MRLKKKKPAKLRAHFHVAHPQAVAYGWELCKISFMERDQVIAALKAHEEELRMAGVESVSLFGSVARGEDAAHDVDLAVELAETAEVIEARRAG